MSDIPTPRTDKAEASASALWVKRKLDCQRVVGSGVSRQLECKLTQVRSELAEAKAKCARQSEAILQLERDIEAVRADWSARLASNPPPASATRIK